MPFEFVCCPLCRYCLSRTTEISIEDLNSSVVINKPLHTVFAAAADQLLVSKLIRSGTSTFTLNSGQPQQSGALFGATIQHDKKRYTYQVFLDEAITNVKLKYAISLLGDDKKQKMNITLKFTSSGDDQTILSVTQTDYTQEVLVTSSMNKARFSTQASEAWEALVPAALDAFRVVVQTGSQAQPARSEKMS